MYRKFVPRRVPLVEQLLTLPEHLSSPPVFSGFVLLDRWFYVSIGHCVACPSLI
jgi:hypothetical protein